MALQALIDEKLRRELQPEHLEVINESGMHNAPPGAESHFKVVVVSTLFEGKPLLARHRMVNDVLKEELVDAIHALSITTKTPAQWNAAGGKGVEPSPKCAGGLHR
ncbi:unnamed protein product [Discosporangium mesarthrocarpum]